MLALTMALILTGCAKNKAVAPAPSPGQTTNTPAAPSGSTGTNAGQGAPAGGGAAEAPAAGTAPTAGTAPAPAAGATGNATGNGDATAAKPQPLTMISRSQYDKITGPMTYDQVVKLLGSPGKLVADAGDRKTYQFQLKDDPKYFVNIVFNKGSLSEKSISAM